MRLPARPGRDQHEPGWARCSTQLEKAAIDQAVAAGVVIVASAGNSGPDGRHGLPRRICSGHFGRRRRVTCGSGKVALRGGTIGVRIPPIPPTPHSTTSAISRRCARYAGSRCSRTGLLGGRAVPVQQSNRTELLLPRRHLAGIAARGRHRRPDAGQEPHARCATGSRAATAETILRGSAIQIPDINQQVRPLPGMPLATPPSWDRPTAAAAALPPRMQRSQQLPDCA